MAINKTVNAAVQEAIDRAIVQRGEIGVQVAAYFRGELVIDAWGGIADPETQRPVDANTLFNVFSVTKAIASTTIHLQAERGLLDYDAPIAEYWPEWGCKGKEHATVRDALTHRTGTPQMPTGVTPEDICDWDYMVEAIAGLQPLFPVGEKLAYQAQNFGWVVGEIVRRTDPEKRAYLQFIQQELCEPLGIKDLWVGIPDHVEPRIARLIDANANAPRPPEESLLVKAIPYAIWLTPEVYERPDVRRACIASTGGIFTARSEARFWALLANGGELDGVRLLSKSRIDTICQPCDRSEPDPVYFNTVLPLSNSGYWMHSDAMPDVCPARGKRTICAPGAGGSLGWADPDTQLAVAFCHNHMTMPQTCESHPAYEIANVIYESLGL